MRPTCQNAFWRPHAERPAGTPAARRAVRRWEGGAFPPTWPLVSQGNIRGWNPRIPVALSLCPCGSQGLSAGGLPTRSPTCRERRFARSFPEGAPGSGPWVRCHRQGVTWCTGSRGRGRLLPQSSSCGCGATSEHPLWPSSRSGAARVAKRRVPRMPQRAAPPGRNAFRPGLFMRAGLFYGDAARQTPAHRAAFGTTMGLL